MCGYTLVFIFKFHNLLEPEAALLSELQCPAAKLRITFLKKLSWRGQWFPRNLETQKLPEIKLS